MRRAASPTVARAAREMTLALVLFSGYKLGRAVCAGQDSRAWRHADQVRRLEQLLGLPSEAAVQAAVQSESLLRAANGYYAGVHFPLMAGFLLWGLLRRPAEHYRWVRDLLVVQTGLALVLHMTFPLAPPRMFPEWGFVDTLAEYGDGAAGSAAGPLANQLAAMPSLHVGWAFLIAYAVARTGPRWLAAVGLAHALTTTAVVVVTANHWWLDGMVGVLLLVGADLGLRWAGRGLSRPG